MPALISENPIFNSKELEENQHRKKSLCDLIRSGDSILMVGAGCSAGLYPDWERFINILFQEALAADADFKKYVPGKDDFLVFADAVKKCVGEAKYYNIIYHQFKPKETTHESFHKALCGLPFRGITTTNYDLILEHALAAVNTPLRIDNSIWIDDGIEEAKIYEFLISLNYSSVHKRVLHIHGRYDQKKSIILCGHEYKTKYGFANDLPGASLYTQIRNGGVSEAQFQELLLNHGLVWTSHRKILWSLLSTRRLVFFGFSMNDPYFKKMFEFVSNDLHTYRFDSHFLVLRVTRDNKERSYALAQELKGKYGVETVFFEDNDGYGGLSRFIFEIEHEVRSVDQISKTSTVTLCTDGDQILTDKLIRISREKNTHED